VHVFASRIGLRHTDAAGIVFFARFFEIAHEAYEDLLRALGQPLPADLARARRILPITRAEADFRTPLRLGDAFRVEVEVRAVSSRSFTLGYRVTTEDGREAARLTTVHVAVDTELRRAVRLPEDLAEALRGA
jgi:1,4-dihydroxy-2-naphthoyl-CoA hydrolase